MLFDETGAFETHRYLKESANGGARARRAKRIMVEAPDLGASLPLSLSSSVCVRIDASRMHLWKALITGPDDTPYANGCFVFDLFLPPDYPNTPPKVLLTTTGGGAVRFNPNLYADGKVRAARRLARAQLSHAATPARGSAAWRGPAAARPVDSRARVTRSSPERVALASLV